ncbi:VOC family protein [Actinoplanes sp. LDG1-06]|uniref:VOC family protein n=1 Tax=Paractinoplanes ovalisporus TaxID=2810368 RepID=A0ABS2AJ67_9ACTN|nr:VOC family protein [Actinoplanes ovalisporus]MBM2619867.1 VOC family protein [Actinoplanes ovalisporus]
MGQGLLPYLCCPDAAAAIDFYTSVFGATEVQRWTADDGRIGHAELSLAGEPLFLADEYPEIGVRSPYAYGGTPLSLVLSVPDAVATAERAVEAGATVERPVKAQDDGSTAGWIIDPSGHRWNLRTAAEELPVEQLREVVGDRYTITEQPER